MLRILEFEPYFAFETEVVFVSIRAYVDDIVAIVERRNIRFPVRLTYTYPRDARQSIDVRLAFLYQ